MNLNNVEFLISAASPKDFPSKRLTEIAFAGKSNVGKSSVINRVLQRIPEDCEDLLDGMVIWPDNMDTEKWYYLAVQEATNSHDYGRKMSGYEFWTVLREVRDWTVYEK